MEDTSGWKIVLIDDEQDIRDVVSIVLEDQGFSISTAKNGEQGLSLCETVCPQIVITDVRMPGINGIKVLEIIKNKFPDIEVIVMTAFGEMAVAVEALQLDASDFITKPVDTDALLIALQRAKQRYASRKTLKDYTRFLEKEKAKTSNELIKSYAFQKNLIENSMDGILACSENGDVVTFNREMEQMLGYEKQEVLGRLSFDRLFEKGGADRLKKSMAGPEYGGENRLFLYETTLSGRSGAKVPVQVSAVMLWDKTKLAGWVCFFRDLRQIRKLERELADQAGILHQDKMISLGRLSASVVHEINNPLFGVLNYIRLMIRIIHERRFSEKDTEKFGRYLDLVEKEIQRCSIIVSSLLAFSRKAEPSFGDVDIKLLLEKCLLLCGHKLELSNIEPVVRVDEDLPVIPGDPNQLQQCIINLVFNAADAMPKGGTVTISCTHERNSGTIQIQVCDTGAGIPEKDIASIFDPFFTTKKEGYGLGLGLSNVSGIVEHHKGGIKVESRPGHTLFTITLPVG